MVRGLLKLVGTLTHTSVVVGLLTTVLLVEHVIDSNPAKITKVILLTRLFSLPN